jgi:psp operon transcriptional activator
VVFDPFDSPWKPSALPRAAAAADDGQERAAPARPAIAADLDSVEDLRASVEAHERAILEHHLGRNRWNQRQTAKALGLTYDQLRHCIRKHKLAEQADEAA